jgi:hypothetical protein
MLPLRDLPIQITVDGVTVSGVITALYPNDIAVEITEPFIDLRTALHVPHFAMYPVNRLATWEGDKTTAITERGRERAEWLLRCLYAHGRGNPGGWPVDVRRNGRRVLSEDRDDEQG